MNATQSSAFPNSSISSIVFRRYNRELSKNIYEGIKELTDGGAVSRFIISEREPKKKKNTNAYMREV